MPRVLSHSIHSTDAQDDPDQSTAPCTLTRELAVWAHASRPRSRARDIDWLKSLFEETDRGNLRFLEGSLMNRDIRDSMHLTMRCDCATGRCWKFFCATRNIPTRSREDLFMHSNDDGVPLLPELATHFPELMLELLESTGLCRAKIMRIILSSSEHLVVF